MNLTRHFIRPLVGVSLALLAVGCGSASNNDQGVSFTNLGFFSADDEGVCEDGGITGIGVTLGSSTGDGNITGISVCMGIQNNLSGQFIRSDRAIVSYSVPGSSIQPPSAVVPFTIVLGPGSTGPDSTLPDGVNNPSKVIVGVDVLPSEIRSFLSLNRESFPEAPYTLIANVTVSGITSAGDRLETNEASLAIEVVVDNPINPTAGDGLTE